MGLAMILLRWNWATFVAYFAVTIWYKKLRHLLNSKTEATTQARHVGFEYVSSPCNRIHAHLPRNAFTNGGTYLVYVAVCKMYA